MRLRALLFDVDGTLADTEERHRLAFNAAFAGAGLGWHWDRALYRNLLRVSGGRERMHAWLAAVDPGRARAPETDALVARLHVDKTRRFDESLRADPLPLRPGVVRLMDEAARAGVQVALVTTTTPVNIEALLAPHFGPDPLRRFDAVIAGNSVARLKPAPDAYEEAVGRLGIDPGECLAFEDSANGVKAATAARIRVLATPTWYSLFEPLPPAFAVLPHLGDPGEPLPEGTPGSPWVTLDTLRSWRDSVSDPLVRQGPTPFPPQAGAGSSRIAT